MEVDGSMSGGDPEDPRALMSRAAERDVWTETVGGPDLNVGRPPGPYLR